MLGGARQVDLEPTPIAFESDRRKRLARPASLARAPRREPAPVLVARLERRVHEGLGDERLVDRAPGRRAQELNVGERGDRLRTKARVERLEVGLGRDDHVTSRLKRPGARLRLAIGIQPDRHARELRQRLGDALARRGGRRAGGGQIEHQRAGAAGRVALGRRR